MINKILNTKFTLNLFFISITHLFILALSFFVLYVLIITVGNDVGNYTIIWKDARNTQFWDIAHKRIEIGSHFVIWFLSHYFSAINTIFVIGILALLTKYYIFRKYLNHILIAYILYVITFAHILDANQIRQSLAICFLFYALLVPPKSQYTYLILTAFAVLFHYSGIIILALYFVRWRLALVILIITSAIFFKYIVYSTLYLSHAIVWINNLDGRVSFINSFWIMQVFIAILCAFYWNSLSEGQRRGALLNLLGVVVYVSYVDYPIIAHRVRELSQLGIFPILFLGARELTYVKLGTSLCFTYIVGYNIYLILKELTLI